MCFMCMFVDVGLGWVIVLRLVERLDCQRLIDREWVRIGSVIVG